MSNTSRNFQKTVSGSLVRHRSILDAMSKFQEASAHVNRAIAKTVTDCGCLKIQAGRQPIPPEASLSEIAKYMQTHIEGLLCPNCKEIMEAELGNLLFYLTAICTLLNLDLDKIIAKEDERISMLGVYSLT